ncbi:NADP-dependent oxidoreductase [Nucisporomicrobium flavum]|uniref:NADP-dependent oxidoreductase n=1 Tax=Nucisporomicrobium flavum TaxID=2785915 RepID=UPI003C2D5281
MTAVPSRAIRFHRTGEPLAVLQEERIEIPDPPKNRVRVRVVATGLNPADWELCRGFLPGALPRGIGYDVAGIIDAVGDIDAAGVIDAAGGIDAAGVIDVAGGIDAAGEEEASDSGGDARQPASSRTERAGVGNRGGHAGTRNETAGVGAVVFGTADFIEQPSAGAADVALLNNWYRVPAGLDPVQAAALPMVVQTAAWTLETMRVEPGATLLVHGAGGMVGYAAVQIALRLGARVVATAGPTFAADLEQLGAQVTPYGKGMPDRVRALTGGEDVDLVLDTPRPSPGTMPDLIALAGGDPRRVMTISNHEEARRLGARVNLDELRPGLTPLAKLLPEYASLAAEGAFHLPIVRAYPLEQWRDAVALSLSGNPHGKVMLVPGREAAA